MHLSAEAIGAGEPRREVASCCSVGQVVVGVVARFEDFDQLIANAAGDFFWHKGVGAAGAHSLHLIRVDPSQLVLVWGVKMAQAQPAIAHDAGGVTVF